MSSSFHSSCSVHATAVSTDSAAPRESAWRWEACIRDWSCQRDHAETLHYWIQHGPEYRPRVCVCVRAKHCCLLLLRLRPVREGKKYVRTKDLSTEVRTVELGCATWGVTRDHLLLYALRCERKREWHVASTQINLLRAVRVFDPKICFLLASCTDFRPQKFHSQIYLFHGFPHKQETADRPRCRLPACAWRWNWRPRPACLLVPVCRTG